MRLSRASRVPVWLCLLWLLVLGAAQAAEQPTWQQLRAHYDYDAQMPLEVRADEPVARGPVTVQTVRFNSINDETVPATVCVPTQSGKTPVVLFLHGLGGSKSDATTVVAPLLCQMGVAIVSIDAQYHGDRKVEGKDVFSGDIETMIGAFRQTIVDNRRAVDYIASRDDLDSDRVVLVGASMGGIMGSIVAALDERIKGAALIVGGGDLVGLFEGSQIDAAAQLRQQLVDLEPYRGALAFIEPTNFAAHIAPRPLHMINGRDDKIVIASSGQALFEAAREPKQIAWYEGGAMDGHMPPIGLLIRELRGFMQAQGLIATAVQTQPE